MKMRMRFLWLVVVVVGMAQSSRAESHLSDGEATTGRPERLGTTPSLREIRPACELARGTPRPQLPPETPPPPAPAPAPSIAPRVTPSPSPSVAPAPSVSPSPTAVAGGWDALMKHHNDERAMVGAPPLRWSEKLAKQAQDWANKCDFNHNPELGSSGQNLYVTSDTRIALAQAGAQASKGWGDEKADFNAQDNTCGTGKVCGHYTQMVWRSTTEVGCAVASCPSGIRSFRPGTIVVCDYGPGGNFIGQRPF